MAIQLAKVRRSVLIISTDPAHNTSDAFNQKFTKTPMLVNGFDNLYAMEVEPIDTQSNISDSEPEETCKRFLTFILDHIYSVSALMSSAKNFLSEFTGGLPGIDEATSFSQMIKLVQNLDFDVVVFDTAPTGHTLRLLQFPTLIEKSLGKFMGMSSQIMPMIQQFGPMLGLKDLSAEQTTSKIKETLEIVRKINVQFKDPVCI